MNPCKSGKYTVFCTQLAAAMGIFILLGGCRRGDEPRMRMGAFFGSPAGMQFPEPNDLGIHGFDSGVNEINGMVYTCKGGFIDIGHVREAADRTAYLVKTVYQNLILNKTDFSFLVVEPSRYWVDVAYPSDWDIYSQQQKETVARDVSLLLGKYLAHSSLIWHEIVTGYGFASAGIFPDTISSFSCEDSYSDLLGIHIGAKALQNQQLRYDDAMTSLLKEALKDLDIQPARGASHAAKLVEGQWYTGGFYFFVTMKIRNYDIGLDDGHISPVLVEKICPEAEARSLPVPGLDEIEQYGFTANVEIETRIFENNRICDSIQLDRRTRINPQIHFRPIMERLEHRQNTPTGKHIAHQQ
jgi:hypothetical protein